MIERPPGGLPPKENQTVRRAAFVFIGGIVGATALAIILVSAGVSANVATGIVAAIAAGVALILMFGVFKIQRYSAEVRRQRRAQPRSERLKRGIPSLVVAVVVDLAIWKQQGNAAAALGTAIFIALCVVWMVIDLWRAPRG